jgi:hypothetical protein
VLRIPNKAAATYPRQAGGFASDIDTIAAALAGDGVLSGLGVAAQGSPDMTVAVAAGLQRQQGFFAYYAGGNVTIAAADASNPRIDLIVVDYNGTVSRTGGTAAALPIPPDIPANSMQLAQVYVPANATTIPNANIVDKRPVAVDFYDLHDEFMSGALVTTGNIGGLNWGFTANGTQALSFLTGTASHPGQLSVGSGATSGNDTRLHLGASATAAVMVLATDLARVRAIVQISSAVSTMRFKFGYGVDISDVGSDSFGSAGAWWEFNSNDSNKWQTETRNASTSSTNTDGGADVATTTWYQLEIIRKQNGDIQFAKNGALLFTHSANLPSVACNVGFVVESNTSAARTFIVDAFGLNFKPLGNRWT